MVKIIQDDVETGRGAHLVIRGYGGIGKTSVALAICHHPTVIKIFGDYRFFVECETTDTAMTLLQEIASHLHLNISKGNAHTGLVAGLDALSSTRNLLLVLDNADTFLYSSDRRQAREIDSILSDIAALPNTTLILTKRGLEQPLSVKWETAEVLDTLTLEAARLVFLSITELKIEEKGQNTHLDALLSALDCVPLAVTLLGQVAQYGDESLESLKERWIESKTDLLKLSGHPDDREASVGASVETSLQSPAIKNQQYAKRLLSIIAYLPEGVLLTYMGSLSAIWETNIHDAARILKQLSLAHVSLNTQFLTTLSPVRDHINRHHRILDGDLKHLQEWHVQLADKGRYEPCHPSYGSSQEHLAINQSNISFILHQIIIGPSPKAATLKAAVCFATFLSRSWPNEELLRLILESKYTLASDDRRLLLCALGSVRQIRGDYNAAKVAYEAALSETEFIGDRIGIAQCLQEIGGLLVRQGKAREAEIVFKKALTDVQIAGNPLEVATCRISLGKSHLAQHRYEDAIKEFETALDGFKSVANHRGIADCYRRISNVHYTTSDHTAAKITLQQAMSDFDRIGDRVQKTECLRRMGDILLAQGNHLDAKVAFEAALSEFTSMGLRFQAARCLKDIGSLYVRQGNYAKAKLALHQALSDFSSIGSRIMVAQCLECLGLTYQALGDLSKAKEVLESAVFELTSIGDCNVPYCLRRLGDVILSQGNVKDARVKFTNALLGFRSIGSRRDAARCFFRLGELDVKEGHMTSAEVSFKAAQEEFEADGDSDGVALCVRRLGIHQVSRKLLVLGIVSLDPQRVGKC
jgi:tetratricopeptide (TPR) repeat protein